MDKNIHLFSIYIERLIMRKIIFITFILCLFACGSVQRSVDNNTYGEAMKNSFERLFTKPQFDSICAADSLPKDLKKWHKMQIRDFETKDGKEMYLFIKRLGKSEEIYRLETIGDSLKITKRETK